MEQPREGELIDALENAMTEFPRQESLDLLKQWRESTPVAKRNNHIENCNVPRSPDELL
jgi:hypothetical protein